MPTRAYIGFDVPTSPQPYTIERDRTYKNYGFTIQTVNCTNTLVKVVSNLKFLSYTPADIESLQLPLPQ